MTDPIASRQAEIIRALGVVPPFADLQALYTEIDRRKRFIQQCLMDSGATTLVLGISGGVDSLTAGRLVQLAVEELRASSSDARYRFKAVRLPHGHQHDEAGVTLRAWISHVDPRPEAGRRKQFALACLCESSARVPAGLLDLWRGCSRATRR